MKISLTTCAILLALISCQTATDQFFAPEAKQIRYSGRVDFTTPQEAVLITSGSFAAIGFTGDSCKVRLKKLNPAGDPNYVSIEMDGEYVGRLRIENNDFKAFNLEVPSGQKKHVVKIFKATEAQTNDVVFGGVECESLTDLPEPHATRLEFIGNSITCGMGINHDEIPCNSGVWYDQHNAYWSYGAIIARKLNAEFVLSSVSGIGMYRNWNSLSPVMPDVYENLHLNTDTTRRWDFSTYTPDLVSICLGTNDLSLGDGTHERLPFDSAEFVNAYISFVNTVYSKYPETKICLLTSPMIHDETAQLLMNCLIAVQTHFNDESKNRKPISVFEFSNLSPHGCDSHPDMEDHKAMAQQLENFYRNALK